VNISFLRVFHWPGREFLRPAGAAQNFPYHPNHVQPRVKWPSVDWSLPIPLSVRVLAGLNREKAIRKAYTIIEARMAYRMIV
jgi:hypothetical protein